MPRLCTVRLRVPEAPGRLCSSAYARLLEEAATAVSSEAGFPPEWYARDGTAWVIRRTTIDCDTPLSGGDDVTVATWVADFRRVRSRRDYEIHRASGSSPAVRASSDWVFVERSSGRPRRIPEPMTRAFAPEGSLHALPREPLPITEPPPDPFAIERRAGPADVDALGHVNNARYLDWIEEATGSAAITLDDWNRAPLYASRHDVEYLDEAKEGDRLRCAVWPLPSGQGGLEWAAEIRRADGCLLTRARTVWQGDA